MYDQCKDKDHSDKEHYIIDITSTVDQMSDVKVYQTEVKVINCLVVAFDNSIWIGDELNCQQKVHVTKDCRVIVGGVEVVIIDSDGNNLTRKEKDKNNKYILYGLKSTKWEAKYSYHTKGQVVVFRNTDIISIYGGHSTVNSEESRFSPSSIVSTPKDNVIVADCDNDTLHILNKTGHLLTTYNTMDTEILFPEHLAITSEGSFIVLFMTKHGSGNLYKMVITGC
ncbi:unnamed protein product [Mytilus coruscus]|uniref:Uncharacterized protein n=1 Tax=Mytilus coruscus TaxID=42192 RepID=A0A6J8BQW2_MYTCO|nr:unnamed protein product [Mytilus coruscus]